VNKLAEGAGVALETGEPEPAVPGESWDELADHWLCHDQLAPAPS